MNEWVDNNKYLLWALHARERNVDTGDQKGEAYNSYLQKIVFNKEDAVPLNKAFFFLNKEFDVCAKMLNNTDLLVARYREFEYSQRVQDDSRLCVANPTPGPINSPSKNKEDALPAALLAANLSLQDVNRMADELLSSYDFTVPPPASPRPTAIDPLPTLDFPPPHLAPTPIAAALAGKAKRKALCDDCKTAATNHTCKLRCCVHCCAQHLEHCTVAPHAKLKAETHRSEMINEITTLLTKPEADRIIFIAYCGENKVPDACRQIRVKGWHTYPSSISAECLRNLSKTETKTFILVRISRMAVAAW